MRRPQRGRIEKFRMRPAIALIALAAACAPHPAIEPLPVLPFHADSTRARVVSDGVIQRFIYSASGPWAIHLLDVDLDRCNAVVAVASADTNARRVRTSQLIRDLQRRADVLGGVNADFFSLTTGRPTGLLVAEGLEMVPPSAQSVLAFDSAGTASISVFTQAAGTLAPFHPRNAVGGRPRIVRDSLTVADIDSAGGKSFAAGRHPRTAVGLARNARRLIFVVVDGRQKPYSDGMTLRELASLMLSLGARDALNLDGGGSATMVYADPAWPGALAVANRPSDKEGERAVGDAVGIVRRCQQ